MLSKLIYKHRFIYTMWMLVFLLGLAWTYFNTPQSAILFANQYYHPALLNMFTFITTLGEWLGFLIALLLLIFLHRYREIMGLIASMLVTVLLVWFLKQVVYHDAIRPAIYLERMGIILPNAGSHELNRSFSFPSGHTAAGFAFFFYSALCTSKNSWKLILVGTAILVGISRVYLAQHFVTDVVAGSLVGVIIATMAFMFLVERQPWPASWLDRYAIPK